MPEHRSGKPALRLPSPPPGKRDARLPAVRKALAVSLVLTALLPLKGVLPFAPELPAGMPDMKGWEKVSGEVMHDRVVRARYEFYVNPARPGLYELIRYRVLADGPAQVEGGAPREKLQWQAGRTDMRRFECGPGARPGGPCRWRELAQGTAEYHREVPVILWLYGAHRHGLLQR